MRATARSWCISSARRRDGGARLRRAYRATALALLCALTFVYAPYSTATSQTAARPADQPAGAFAAAPDRFFTSGDVRIRYREAGRGEPVVLIHGYSNRLER